MKGEWIPGYEGRYSIERDGTVYRAWKEKDVPIAEAVKRGSYIVRLTAADGTRHEHKASTLMRRTYFPHIPESYALCHKNKNLADNSISNLIPITRRELGKKTAADSRRKPVAKIDAKGEVAEYYPSAREAARQNYMSHQTVADRCNGKVKSRYASDGYEYRWAD